MEDYDIFVPRIAGTYAYPYVAQITGEHPVFTFKRRFLKYDWPESYSVAGRWFEVSLPEDGVYECCIKRFDRRTRQLISRKTTWFVLFDEEFYEIDKQDVLFALYNVRAQSMPVPGRAEKDGDLSA